MDLRNRLRDLNHVEKIKSDRGVSKRRNTNLNRIDLGNRNDLFDVHHMQTQPLEENNRVGFSIRNSTGQPIRYLHKYEGGQRIIQYVNDSERGAINFVASTTLIRNNDIVEEAFAVQSEHADSSRSRNKKSLVGHRVALQVVGYRWLPEVQADKLGVEYEELNPVVGCQKLRLTNALHSWKISNALKLVAEVLPQNGGRVLRLRSVFTIKNNTNHAVKLMATEFQASDRDRNEARVMDDEVPYCLSAGDSFCVPIALLQRSAMASKKESTPSLGNIFIRPAELTAVKEELKQTKPVFDPGNVTYTIDPINLFSIVQNTSDILGAIGGEGGGGMATSIVNELSVS